MSSLEVATPTLPDEEKAKKKIKARDAHSPTANTSSNPLNTHAYTSAKRKPSK
jgi:hypothetical protein